MAFKLAEAFVEIKAKDREYFASQDRVHGGLGRLGAAFTKFAAISAAAFTGAAIAATALSKKLIALAQEQEVAEKRLEAVVRATGGASGFTAGQLKEMASQLQQVTRFGDETILPMQSILLTFRNIKGVQFERVTASVLDMAEVLGTDLASAAVQLGKALNDPVANLSALSRSGIQFSEEQKALIKSLAETNRLAEAQTVILDELDAQFGGVAQAMAETSKGGLDQLKNDLGDLGEEIGNKLVPAFDDLIGRLDSFLKKIRETDTAGPTLTEKIALLAGVTGDVLLGNTLRANLSGDQSKNFLTKGVLEGIAADRIAALKAKIEAEASGINLLKGGGNIGIPAPAGGDGAAADGGTSIANQFRGVLHDLAERARVDAFYEAREAWRRNRDGGGGEEEGGDIFSAAPPRGGNLVGISELSNRILAAGAGSAEDKIEKNTKKAADEIEKLPNKMDELITAVKDISAVS